MRKEMKDIAREAAVKLEVRDVVWVCAYACGASRVTYHMLPVLARVGSRALIRISQVIRFFGVFETTVCC